MKSLELIPRYEAPSSWWELVPIAHLMIDIIKPKVVVELGSHYGVSFFSFCEAAEHYSPETYIYGVDSWIGDEQAGLYGNEVYEQVREHREQYHKQRSNLLRCMFNDACSKFDDKSIDLLHIDGLHTYEAVKNDYESWKPKLKENGTILFHDWNEKGNGFGVWKLWEEIKQDKRFRCIEIKYGHGLGIATLSESKPYWHEIILNNIDALKCKGYLLNKINEMSQSIMLVNNKMKTRELHINNLEKMNADKQEQISNAEKILQDMNKKVFK